jgi:UDP-N-acetylmuramoyl-tripeptide--D-alanyl-D-alanine ligase
MDSIDLRTLGDAVGGEIRGEAAGIRGVKIDSRHCGLDDVFFALPGEHSDGHAFVPELGGHAAAAVVESWVDAPLPQCRVVSTRGALAALARWNRERSAADVVGLTGSNGKTTVKELAASIFAEAGPTLATQGNFNNELGVPLTLCRLDRRHQYAVIEMGANGPGDIAYLTAIARPRAGLITNAGPAHLEGFGSLQGVAAAKGEIYSGLPADGVAVINGEDRFADYWRSLIGDRRCLSFAADDEEADVVARPDDGELRLILPDQLVSAAFALEGRHNRLNAAAAAALAYALGIPGRAIAAGLAKARPVNGRLAELVTRAGGTLIDDSYNANPGSLAAGADVLAARGGERCLVLGDMAELGSDSQAFHHEAGEQVRRRGIERLFALGEYAGSAVAGFGAGGEAFSDREALVARLHELDGPAQVFLIKGSRSAAMETVVAALARRSGSHGTGDDDAATDY